MSSIKLEMPKYRIRLRPVIYLDYTYTYIYYLRLIHRIDNINTLIVISFILIRIMHIKK